SDTGGKPKPDTGYNTWFEHNGDDACAVAISRLLAANVNSAVETPAFAESLGRIPRQRRRDTMKHWGNSRGQSQEAGWSWCWCSALAREGLTTWFLTGNAATASVSLPAPHRTGKVSGENLR